jgi:DNA polymerase III delta subunit
MIYLIQGSDSIRTRHKYDALIESLLARKLDSVAWKIDSENYDEEKLRELIVSQGLFVQKFIVGCDHLIGDKKARTFMLENLPAMKESANIFLILEDELDEKTLKLARKFTEKDLSFDKKLGAEKKFNVFALTDALGERDRKRLWILYQQALRAGLEAEKDIFWRLWWVVKQMRFFQNAKDPSVSELKGFARSKIQTYAKNFTSQELENLSGRLVELFHAVRRGEGEMETELELLIFQI